MQYPEESRRMAALAKEFDACRPAFTALGDENRQRIVMELLGHFGGLRVGQLAGRVGLSRPAVSHHLKILKDAGLVNLYKQGTRHFYHMESAVGQWEQIASLVAHVDELARQISGKKACGIIFPEDEI